MDISSVGSSNSAQQRPVQAAGAQLQAVISQLIRGNRSSADDVTALSLAAQLQSGTVGLRTAFANLSEVSSVTQVASAGIDDIASSLKTLQSLAKQATNPSITPEARTRLSDQFKAFTAKIDEAVAKTTFNGQKLLDGSISGSNALALKGLLASNNSGQGEGLALSISNLSSANLFQGKTLDLSSPERAQATLAAVTDTLNSVTDIRDQVGGFQKAVDYIAVTIDTVAANQIASESLLPELDLLSTKGNGFFSLSDLQKNVSKALSAQGNLLNPALLQLVN